MHNKSSSCQQGEALIYHEVVLDMCAAQIYHHIVIMMLLAPVDLPWPLIEIGKVLAMQNHMRRPVDPLKAVQSGNERQHGYDAHKDSLSPRLPLLVSAMGTPTLPEGRG